MAIADNQTFQADWSALGADLEIVPGPDSTMAAAFLQAVEMRGDRVALRSKDRGLWQAFSWRDYGKQVRRIALALIARGFQPHDRACILADNCPEWFFADMAVITAGGISCGIYATNSPEQTAYVINDCQARVVFVENEEQLDKVLQTRTDLPSLEWIVVFDMEGLADFTDPMVISLADLSKSSAIDDPVSDTEWRRRIVGVRPEDTAILIYTSGTTGPPKGAMLSHTNLIYQAAALNIVMQIGPDDELLSFLPLSHIAERLISVVRPIFNGSVANFAESPDTMAQNLREISPTVFFAVPRIWEKFYSRATIAVEDGTWLERQAFRLAFYLAFRRRRLLGEGGKVSLWLRLAHWAMDHTVLHRTRKLLGLERVRYVTTGAAPIAPELIRWYLALGVDMMQAYGLTECAGVASLPLPGQHRLGTVGKALPGSEVRLSEQGEILIRGPHIFQGYWRKPEQSRAAMVDGWLNSGDIGEIDSDGFIRVVDRSKDIIITSGGKNVSPSEIENQLKFSPFISDAIVIGEARPYLSALVMIDYDNIAKYAQDHAIPFTNYTSLCARAEIHDLIAAEVEAVNQRFARVEQIKKFRLIDVELTTEDEEFTPTLKLKRNVVAKRHKALIDAIYAPS
ncbi:MAG: long-chain fatty acid--CoA ligase [Rhodobacteraceae bacterium]|nr:long-chain fatty acid--CoA ligase [Paracoccaceae bacterium]